MKTKTPQQKPRITKYIFDFNSYEIKKRNLDFFVTYCETGNTETYTEILNWSEIEKPEKISIEVQKITVLENDKVIKELTKTESEKLISLLDYQNKKQRF